MDTKDVASRHVGGKAGQDGYRVVRVEVLQSSFAFHFEILPAIWYLNLFERLIRR